MTRDGSETPPGETDLALMLRTLRPRLNHGLFALVTVAGQLPDGALEAAAASVREQEGMSLLLPAEAAIRLGFTASFHCRWITLDVHSSLAAVGLTATVATALAQHAISCNMVAGFHHDHLLVPEADAARAMSVLEQLAAGRRPAFDSPGNS